MRDTVSIIFAAIFMVLVIIILPLFSILDRQDNISYNVVLTQTTKFVDEIRTNGFITQTAYENYISSLASTGNTYKVTLEAYKHSLIPATDEYGNVIPDSYTDELELYNTNDIISYLSGDKINVEVDDSNKKENVYLFEKSDELYVRVYNTNITAGSVMYNMIMGAVETKVIDITYGGAINNVNWELYDKIEMETIATPEVTLSVPVNANNNINVQKLVTDDQLKSVECIVEDYGGLFADPYEMCEDIGVEDLYKYIYDIDQTENQTITIAVRFTDVKQLQVREQTDLEYVYGDAWGLADILLDIFDLKSYKDWDEIVSQNVFDNNTYANRQIEQYIINNFIVLNGMTADVNLTRVGVGSYHDFNIVLTNIKMSTIGALTENASVAVLPGLGRNAQHDLTVGDETVIIQLGKKTDVRTTAILGPYNWKQFLKLKVADAAAIATSPKMVYKNQEIFFKVQYTGIKDLDPAGVINKIRSGLSFNRDVGTNVDETTNVRANLTYYTPLEMRNLYGITVEADTIIVKFSYVDTPTFTYNLAGNRYLNLGVDWYPGMEAVRSEIFMLDRDTYEPKLPTAELRGTLGNDGWYVSDVELIVANNGDKDQVSGYPSGDRPAYVSSGVYRSTVTLSGGQTMAETDTSAGIMITENTLDTNPTNVQVKTEDYVGNSAILDTFSVKIDKLKPLTPVITISPEIPANGWHTENVQITVAEGSDEHSKLNRTTYEIEGANAKVETLYTGTITLTETGISRVTIRHYDNAGNTSSLIQEIKIDKGEPAVVTFENINGLKRNPDSEWYHTDVETRITVHYTGSTTQKKPSKYEVLNKDGTTAVALTEFSEDVKDIILSGSEEYTIKVYTYTVGGDVGEYSHTVKIDGDAPNVPDIDLKGTKGKLNNVDTIWYTSDVIMQVKLTGDNGTAGVTTFNYIKKVNDGEEVLVEDVADDTGIELTDEGTTYIKIIVPDEAGNESVWEEEIKIDKTAPTPAKIGIESILGENGWYKAAVIVSHTESADDVSGISNVEIKTQTGNDEDGWVDATKNIWEIQNSTKSTKIILTTYNGAGLTSTDELIVKIDKEEPEQAPGINISVADGGVLLANGTNGIYMANAGVDISIVASTDTVTGEESGTGKTYYRVTSNNSEVIEKTEGTTFSLPTETNVDVYYSIEAMTYDVAGNYRQSTAVVRICTVETPPPVIEYVNGISGSSVEDTTSAITVTLGEVSGKQLDIYVNDSIYETVTADEETGALETAIAIETGISVGESVTIYAIVTDIFDVPTGASNVVTYTRIAEGGS